MKLSEPEKPKKKKKTAKTSKAKDAEVLAGEKLREAAATTFYSAYKAIKDKSRPEKTSPTVTEAGHDGEEYDPWSPLDHSRSPSPVDPQQKETKTSRPGNVPHNLTEKNNTTLMSSWFF